MADFFAEVSSVLNPEGAQWRAVSVEGITYAVFALPYVQLAPPADGFAFIDSYYIASNRAYFLRKKLASSLEGAGFAVSQCSLPYKHLAVAAGLGVQLRSTLVANERFGTRMALEIIGVEGTFANEVEKRTLVHHPPVDERCLSCKICEKVCPQGCLDGNGFAPEKCLRSMQDSGAYPDSAAKAAGANVWGCDTCQRFCPFNAGQPVEEPQEEYREKLRLQTLFDAFAAGKKGCEPYRDMLGGNYLRPARMMALTLNAMANTKKPGEYLPCAQLAENHRDERVRAAAQRLKKTINEEA